MTLEKKQLGDLLTFQRGFDITKKEQLEGNVPIVSSSGVSSFHSEFKVRGPGVVVGRKGTLGTVHFLRSNFWPHDTTLWIKDFKGNTPEFFRYFLRSLKLENFDVGASNPTLNRNHLHKLWVRFPKDKRSQQKIAATLTAYDDLIENNRQRIALLEKMAEEIYREWFVRLRFPGHEQTPVNKGVPEGWKVKTVREITDFYIGGGWGNESQSTEFTDRAYVIRGTDIPKLQVGENVSLPLRFHKPSNLRSRTLQAGDIIFEVSGGSKDQLLGRSILISEQFLSERDTEVMCASFCKLIRLNTKEISPHYFQQFLRLYYKTGLVGTFQVQSTGISNYQFEAFLSAQTVLVPNDSLMNDFSRRLEEISSQISILANQAALLTQTRDLLLNRLISGKLRVDDLDIQFPPSMSESA